MGDASEANTQNGPVNGNGKKQILLNAFDMSTVGHLSPGQWKVLSLCSHSLQPTRTDRHRIPKTSQQQSADSTTGSIWQSSSSAAASMLCFWPTQPAVMIPMRGKWTNVFDEPRNGR